MSLVQWTDQLSVNVAEIDRQHQKLIELLNGLHVAIREQRSADILGDTIDQLIDYADYHFATEEKYFDQFGYSEAQPHKEEHVAFAERVTDFKRRADKGEMILALEVVVFVSDWVLTHMGEEDVKYGPFFNKNGLT